MAKSPIPDILRIPGVSERQLVEHWKRLEAQAQRAQALKRLGLGGRTHDSG